MKVYTEIMNMNHFCKTKQYPGRDQITAYCNIFFLNQLHQDSHVDTVR